MSELKRKVINEIIKKEGGYVNDPSDSGGETNYGITKRVARAYGFKGKMKNLTKDYAYMIYSKLYWDKLKLDDIEDWSSFIAAEMADTGVNMGTGRAARFLQRSLNVLNNKQMYYNDLVVDGQIGNKTIKALKSYFLQRGTEGETVLFNMLNALQGSFYVTLAERREKDEKFVYGWFWNRVS